MPNRYRSTPYVPARDPLSAIPPSRHPFQFWVMFAMVLSGFGNLVTPGSEILQEGLHLVSHKIWAATLMVGSGITLTSAWWRDRITGLLLERIGLLAIGLSAPVYALVVFVMIGITGLVTGVILTATVGIASIWRAVHVSRELRILRAFMHNTYMDRT